MDAHRQLLQLDVDDSEIARRRAEWRQPEPRYKRGSLANLPRSRARPTKEPAQGDAAGRHIQRGAYAAPLTPFL
ncbi:hypothetical protein [Sinorhizobium fredii]|uniref:hypothetical protein n=1 Tax=Rhizobium fredii TaxID=380 RepID=UPI001F3B180F|nr:hypothetical protein [Sinorhizobium fredii]